MNRSMMFLILALLALAGTVSLARAEGGEKLPQIHWSFEGVFGTYDRAALQRGFQVYREVCASCHSLKRVYYRDLAALGYSAGQIKAVAAGAQVGDGPNDQGEMFQRPGLPSDRFVSPFPNVQAAAYANGGAEPPDMSLLVKARHGGASHVYGILTGFEDTPAGKALQPGQFWNKFMPGNVIAMSPPLTDGRVTYTDASPQTVAQYAMDVSQFLAWASEPHMELRKRTGIKAFLFLLVFTGVMYTVKRRMWTKIH